MWCLERMGQAERDEQRRSSAATEVYKRHVPLCPGRSTVLRYVSVHPSLPPIVEAAAVVVVVAAMVSELIEASSISKGVVKEVARRWACASIGSLANV